MMPCWASRVESRIVSSRAALKTKDLRKRAGLRDWGAFIKFRGPQALNDSQVGVGVHQFRHHPESKVALSQVASA
jgi:hypothetical protein